MKKPPVIMPRSTYAGDEQRIMIVQIDLNAGRPPYWQNPTKAVIAKNIDAIDRTIQGKPQVVDVNYLVDTKSILEAIKEQLPEA